MMLLQNIVREDLFGGIIFAFVETSPGTRRDTFKCILFMKNIKKKKQLETADQSAKARIT